MSFTEQNQTTAPAPTTPAVTPLAIGVQVADFHKQVERLRDLKEEIRGAIPAWEHTFQGKSELTDEQKKQLRSAIRVGKRETAIPDKPKPSTPTASA